MVRTLERYLEKELKEGKIDFKVRASKFITSDKKEAIGFYIYPDGKDGETMDFKVLGNELITLNDTHKTA